ncbi:hypothetical protein TSMEX_003263 [Taenia solium]|eukprot:TsM_001149800 transcript=TsM_001149800 gene=TsM_001149800
MATDERKTVYTVPNGYHNFQTVSLGLCNAAITFQRLAQRPTQTALISLVPPHPILHLIHILAFGVDMRVQKTKLTQVLHHQRNAELALNPRKSRILQ